MRRVHILLVCIIVMVLSSCRTGPQREVISRQIREAEIVLQQAQNLEAPVYAPETYLEAQLIIRKAKSLMNSEDYAAAESLAEKAKKVGHQAREESQDEQVRVKAEAERLLTRGEEIWSGYDQGEEKIHAPEALSDIKKLLDDGYSYLESDQYMDAMDTAQRSHQKLALLPEVVEKKKAALIKEKNSKAVSQQSAEEIIKVAQQKASQIIEDARKKAQNILLEAQITAAKARLEEFERIYPATYKVKEGETIIDIARRREIFNDQFMWPLIYKSNRDQMRDPKVVFPGQILSIPRDVSFEELIEARKQAGAPPPYIPPYNAYNPEFYRRYLLIKPEMNNTSVSTPAPRPTEPAGSE